MITIDTSLRGILPFAPLITGHDPLPAPPRRILVAGTSGSGKSTLARRLSVVLEVPYVELDALHHGPNWTPRPTFEADVRGFAAGPAWVTEWHYGAVRDLLAARADCLVWLDLPRRVVMRQVIARTVRRRLRRESLWNGNIEPPLGTILRDRDHIIRWAWRTHPKTARRIDALAVRRPDLPIVRLRSHREAELWLRGPVGPPG